MSSRKNSEDMRIFKVLFKTKYETSYKWIILTCYKSFLCRNRAMPFNRVIELEPLYWGSTKAPSVIWSLNFITEIYQA